MTTEQETELLARFTALGITRSSDQAKFIADHLGRRTSRTNPPTGEEVTRLIALMDDMLNGDGS